MKKAARMTMSETKNSEGVRLPMKTLVLGESLNPSFSSHIIILREALR